MTNEKQTPTTEAKPKEKTTLTQREAVYLSVVNVVKNKNIQLKKKQALKEVLDVEHLEAVYRDIARGFKAGKIALKDNENNRKKLEDPKAMQIYIIGLVSNWMKRDGRLNGEQDFNS